MSPITHFLASWVVADTVLEEDRDKMLVACAGILPDLDSLGVVCDFASPALGGPETNLYADFHHFLFHGLAVRWSAGSVGRSPGAISRRRAVIGGLRTKDFVTGNSGNSHQ